MTSVHPIANAGKADGENSSPQLISHLQSREPVQWCTFANAPVTERSVCHCSHRPVAFEHWVQWLQQLNLALRPSGNIARLPTMVSRFTVGGSQTISARIPVDVPHGEARPALQPNKVAIRQGVREQSHRSLEGGSKTLSLMRAAGGEQQKGRRRTAFEELR